MKQLHEQLDRYHSELDACLSELTRKDRRFGSGKATRPSRLCVIHQKREKVKRFLESVANNRSKLISLGPTGAEKDGMCTAYDRLLTAHEKLGQILSDLPTRSSTRSASPPPWNSVSGGLPSSSTAISIRPNDIEKKLRDSMQELKDATIRYISELNSPQLSDETLAKIRNKYPKYATRWAMYGEDIASLPLNSETDSILSLSREHLAFGAVLDQLRTLLGHLHLQQPSSRGDHTMGQSIERSQFDDSRSTHASTTSTPEWDVISGEQATNSSEYSLCQPPLSAEEKATFYQLTSVCSGVNSRSISPTEQGLSGTPAAPLPENTSRSNDQSSIAAESSWPSDEHTILGCSARSSSADCYNTPVSAAQPSPSLGQECSDAMETQSLGSLRSIFTTKSSFVALGTPDQPDLIDMDDLGSLASVFTPIGSSTKTGLSWEHMANATEAQPANASRRPMNPFDLDDLISLCEDGTMDLLSSVGEQKELHDGDDDLRTLHGSTETLTGALEDEPMMSDERIMRFLKGRDASLPPEQTANLIDAIIRKIQSGVEQDDRVARQVSRLTTMREVLFGRSWEPTPDTQVTRILRDFHLDGTYQEPTAKLHIAPLRKGVTVHDLNYVFGWLFGYRVVNAVVREARDSKSVGYGFVTLSSVANGKQCKFVFDGTGLELDA